MAKGKRQTTETLDIPHEVVETNHGTAAVAVMEKTAEDRKKEEIQKLNLADARIAELKKNFAGLTIEKDGLQKVKEARAIVRGFRTGLEKKRKDINADYLVITRGVNGEAKRLTALLEEIENPLDEQIKAEEEKKEQERREKEEAEQLKLNQRVNDLTSNGMFFNGNYYAIGEFITIDVVTLKNLPDEDFTRLLDRVKVENENIIAERQRLENEERERVAQLQRQQEEQEKERQRLADERAQMEREREELKKQIQESRVSRVLSMGFIAAHDGNFYYRLEAGVVVILGHDLKEVAADLWNSHLEEKAVKIEALNNLQKSLDAEKEKKNEQNNSRRAVLFGLGLKYANGFFTIENEGTSLYKYSEQKLLNAEEQEFKTAVETITGAIQTVKTQIEQEAREREEKAELERKEAEAARLAAMGDAEKVKEWLGEVLSNVTFTVQLTEGSEVQKRFATYKTTIEKGAAELIEYLDSLETK